ncbi:unnamed protein product [Moneuplotes crassus]|uniref:Aminotransferase class III-fold pyridoxal phosphate-dependent enzyme n=2 Tax=Euplotes crassus TaxID=5936 RepID=A0AAD1ULZ0_EUPCR|nr:unnamed protein product [Moneuplotes crassus]
MFWREFNQKNWQLVRKVTNFSSKTLGLPFAVALRNPTVVNADYTSSHSKPVNEWMKTSLEDKLAGHLFDYKKSRGNFVCDYEGNEILDLAMQGGNLAFGYNPNSFLHLRVRKLYNRLTSSIKIPTKMDSDDYMFYIKTNILPYAPKGMGEVHFTKGKGKLAVESSIKAAILSYRESRGGFEDIDWEKFAASDFSDSVDLLQDRISVLSFESARAPGSNSFAKHDWPVIQTPDLTYPYQKNKKDNIQEENRRLKEVRETIAARESSSPVGAIIVEPITFLGNCMATPTFYRKLRDIAKEHNIPFIVDETRTGFGKTAKFWGLEHWHLDDMPEFVAFGGSSAASGFFTTRDHIPYGPHKLPTIGDESLSNVIEFSETAEYIKKKSLVDKVEDVSGFIKVELDRINKKKGIYTNLRGNGTFLGLDFEDYYRARHFQKYLLRNGVLVSLVGQQTLGIRPSLLLRPDQASHLRDAFIDYYPRFHTDVWLD